MNPQLQKMAIGSLGPQLQPLTLCGGQRYLIGRHELRLLGVVHVARFEGAHLPEGIDVAVFGVAPPELGLTLPEGQTVRCHGAVLVRPAEPGEAGDEVHPGTSARAVEALRAGCCDPDTVSLEHTGLRAFYPVLV